ncbi:hypothetical protein PTE30175_02540 [Pandoraea terrae]|uniref:Uncharacterized protein n=1 Tax=Pandoraea terrae TaxID=1537710 RepID=A0A5E4VGV0_9BURK|nr:hypothetical protein PTE30175_02540 [Pandoraea terrae]
MERNMLLSRPNVRLGPEIPLEIGGVSREVGLTEDFRRIWALSFAMKEWDDRVRPRLAPRCLKRHQIRLPGPVDTR